MMGNVSVVAQEIMDTRPCVCGHPYSSHRRHGRQCLELCDCKMFTEDRRAGAHEKLADEGSV